MDQATGMRHGPIELRLVRSRDARPLQHELLSNRAWLQPWEATVPYGSVSFDMRLIPTWLAYVETRFSVGACPKAKGMKIAAMQLPFHVLT